MGEASLTLFALADDACRTVSFCFMASNSSSYNNSLAEPAHAHPSHPMNLNEYVSAIMPARNEERTIARAVRSVAEQAEVREVVVIDDQSTDGTGDVLRRLAAEQPKVRMIEAGPVPGGVGGEKPGGMARRAESRLRLAAFHGRRCGAPPGINCSGPR